MTRRRSQALSGYLAALAASPKPLLDAELDSHHAAAASRSLRELISGSCRSPTRRSTRSSAASTTIYLRAELVTTARCPNAPSGPPGSRY